MVKNTSIWLSKHFETFIKERVGKDRYSNAGEVIRVGFCMNLAGRSEAFDKSNTLFDEENS